MKIFTKFETDTTIPWSVAYSYIFHAADTWRWYLDFWPFDIGQWSWRVTCSTPPQVWRSYGYSFL